MLAPFSTTGLSNVGDHGGGRLGQDNTTTLGSAAGQMENLTTINLGTNMTAVQVSAGKPPACALLNNGTVKCWGNGADGGLGKDNTANLGGSAGPAWKI